MSLPDTRDVVQRISHAHYVANSLLCAALPVLLLLSLDLRSSPAVTTALVAAPVLLALSVGLRKSSDNIESLHESVTFQLRLFNLFGLFFLRNEVGITKGWVLAYFGVWMACSFLFPQPPYLGQHKLNVLTPETFDTHILLLSPADSVQIDEPKIVELSDEMPDEPAPPASSPPDPTQFHLVLFYADYDKKSRDLELTLARLSNEMTTPALDFCVLDSAKAPTTFYDLGISTSPMAFDIPQLRLYKGGKVVQQYPLSEGEARRKMRRERSAKLEEDLGVKGGTIESEDGSDDGADSDAESEDEREVQRIRDMSRFRWVRSATAIVRTFRLDERAGLPRSS
ncbi:hypothetical protein RTG_02980 [Rhodotorula toruloides ATCC 204091]|uniref:Thioredoxin domain-containing protein n=1 Tax=Rhodotorula toruloides TaxID=5286 RepID=A0A0K3CQH0_RHOTO|nr:hypothetical protein RTG_02980 [Rhodotorula toruloides ATCC 204091]KAK4329833.1 hypothetical protein RTBOTA2_005803 [Rhodotorula toruloides]PRQ72121.1 hypothetical protein AAT19DRAFT_9460 [Rhodotorula toruloides]